ncbi:polysaccharide biosynthesis protein [Asticcacaulis excentricus]|uniref:Polysaccharide biosynthesis protein CapD n=1 Tax=Asticcacaulis excentricus (strain ATCC 15261 / DSM 4724 / KCTC 12464 / NCIMB 9791 / VKM B-1370 / CB 48) TaxID=573065 RepID=E8RLB7_ASTEC|nr:polysaccharide biosynthesis protein [Asticcacaulis excentricus]ADU12607.1 polysaccharide biosynthesis protein CapD [Asticcacaulis excentricus CB 48]
MAIFNYRILRFLAKSGLMGRRNVRLTLADPNDQISYKSLLQRPQVHLDHAALNAFYAGKRILITGGGGSIGSEIARQALRLGAAHVTLIDHSELALYDVEQSLNLEFGKPPVSLILCSIRRKARLEAIFVAQKPDVIFHAAALKHVPMVEINPSEGVLTNVMGTQYVIDAAQAANVKQLVLISSDKAVAPASMMGATKRLAEHLISSQMGHLNQACVVRFGNVLGSTGSVVPLFRAQIERGGPITLTDPKVERFFMTIFEAVQLVMTAAMHNATNLSEKSSLYILEMGEPIRIYDLAKRMIDMYGLKVERDIKIVLTGLRDGEKITEALLDDNEIREPLRPGIFKVVNQAMDLHLSPNLMSDLFTLAERGEDEIVKAQVFRFVKTLRDYSPAPPTPHTEEV